jgi:hypothetical protein
LLFVGIISEFTKESRDQNLILSVVGFGVLIVAGFLGFVNLAMAGLLTIEAIIIFYMNRGGY